MAHSPEGLARCALCNGYFTPEEMKWFRMIGASLYRASDDWWQKAGTRHICKWCIYEIVDRYGDENPVDEKRKGSGKPCTCDGICRGPEGLGKLWFCRGLPRERNTP